MKRSWYWALAAALVATLAVGSWGCLITYDADAVDIDDFVPDDTRPRLFVVSPTPSQQVGETLSIRVEVRNLTLVAPGGQANRPNEGHLRVYIDEVCLDDPADPGPGGTTACPAPRAITSTAFDVPVGDLDEGTHRLQVEVRNNDGSRFGYLGPDDEPVTIQPVLIDFTKLETN